MPPGFVLAECSWIVLGARGGAIADRVDLRRLLIFVTLASTSLQLLSDGGVAAEHPQGVDRRSRRSASGSFAKLQTPAAAGCASHPLQALIA